MKLRTLGRLELDGSAFHWPKPLALLAYLALEGPQERHHLARLFWPAATDPLNSLTVALSQLRKGAPGAVDADRRAAATLLDCDARELRAALASAELQRALELYQGPFLEGFQLRQEGVEFEEWIFEQREQLADLLRRELLTRANSAAGAARFDRAAGYAERAVALKEAPPLPPDQLERLHELLLAGDSYTAKSVGVEAESFGATLANSPDEARARLRQSLQAPALPYALPQFSTPFVGREMELNALEQLLFTPEVKLVTVVGPGGSGKTRLAVALAERFLAHATGASEGHGFPDGLWFVPLADAASADEAVPDIIAALGLASGAESDSGDGPSTSAPEERLLAYLSGKRLLLILDNVEQLRHDEQLTVLQRLLNGAPGLRLLTTSRERLAWRDEQLYHLRGFELPTLDAAKQATAAPAAQLFRQRARRLSPDFEFATGDGPALLEICRLVDGLPLGLELAATWTDTLSLTEIAAGIRRSLDFLNRQLSDVPERQRSLRAVFDQAYEQLAPAARQLFARLSVFRGGFTREAAEQVAGAEPHLLARLVTASLIDHERSRERYHLHELLRQYGDERLSKADREATVENHAAYFCSWLARLAPQSPGPEQPLRLALIEPDADNVRTAWQQALRAGRDDLLEAAIDPLGAFWQRRGRLSEGARAFTVATQAPASRPDAGLQARLEIWRATFDFLLGERTAASGRLVDCLAKLEEVGSANKGVQAERALALLRLGLVRLSNDAAGAEAASFESLKAYRELNNSAGAAEALELLGVAAFRRGDGARAQSLLEESLALRRAQGDTPGVAALLPMLALLAMHRARFEEALRLARESYRLVRPLGDRARQAGALSLLGMSHFWLGRFAAARTLFEESLKLHDEVGNRHALPQARAYAGLASLRLGRYQEARVQAEQARMQARELNDRAMIGWGLWLLGSASLGLGQLELARRQLQESIAIYREIGQANQLGWSLAVLALVERQVDRPEAARSLLHEALQRSLPRRDFPSAILALPGLALLQLNAGEEARAVELLALLLRYPVVANCHWFEDIAIRRLREVEAALAPEVATAARERGGNLDLWEVVGAALEPLSVTE